MVTAAAAAAVLTPFVSLFDTDSYLHLALARRYAGGQIRGGLEWARLSAMADGYGDKELLFHLLLAPLATLSRSTLAAKAALVLLNGAIAAALAVLLSPYLGRLSRVAHLALAFTALDYSGRLLRLRPELLSLLLVLITLSLAARAHYRSLGLLAFTFTLAYSGWQVLPLLLAAFFAWELLARGHRPWAMLVWPAAGMGLGIVLHPQFPANVRIWLLQNVLRYLVPLPDAGPEMQSGLAAGRLLYDSGLVLALAVLWHSARPAATPRDPTTARMRAYAGLALLIFSAFFVVLPERFGLYVAPLATLAVACELSARGLRPSARITPRGRGVTAAFALLSVAVLGGFSIATVRRSLVNEGCFDRGWAVLGEAFGRAVPAGARVAASWSDSESYAYWAPQGRYPNVLDPVFMAIPMPEAYRASLSLFEGSAPDVPLLVHQNLSSEFLAFAARRTSLLRRTAADPRLRNLLAGQHVLFALVPGGNSAFALDWHVAPPGQEASAVDRLRIAGWPSYPRFGEPSAAAIEGFVDQSRVGPPIGCRVFARTFQVESPRQARWEISSWGPSGLWVDGGQLVRALAGSQAILGEGALVELPLTAGEHFMVVESCPHDRVGGFYLVAR